MQDYDDYVNGELARRDRDNEAFSSWVEKNEWNIINSYCESLDFSDVPDDYVQSLYESFMDGDD